MVRRIQASRNDHNQFPELQICIAETLYDIESILADPASQVAVRINWRVRCRRYRKSWQERDVNIGR